MKFLLLFFSTAVISFANHVHWQGDYDKALQQAHKEQKPLFVLVVKDGKLLCNKIIKNIFMNQPYIKTINKNIVSVIVTYEGVLSYPIELYYTTLFPTLFLVDSQKELFIEKPLYGNEINISSVKKF